MSAGQYLRRQNSGRPLTNGSVNKSATTDLVAVKEYRKLLCARFYLSIMSILRKQGRILNWRSVLDSTTISLDVPLFSRCSSLFVNLIKSGEGPSKTICYN